MTDKLTAKQQAFIAAYISNGNNGKQAALAAGYASARAGATASLLLHSARVAQAIAASAVKAEVPVTPTNAVGRPTVFNPALVYEMLDRIAAGESVRSICASDGMPAMTTFFRWLRENDEFRQQYARAKEIQAEFLAEDLLAIADDGTNDYVERENKDGSTSIMLDAEHVQRSKLRVETRKWIASKLLARKYGDRLQTEVVHKFAEMTDAQLDERIQQLQS